MDRIIPEVARVEIERRLDLIEKQNGVKVLYACESGSRAWGFASTDSDFDVRFIYLRPVEWYLSVDLEERRDVIEMPLEGDWDVNGWDLRKALRLFRKSNPPLLEWLQSPIVYRDEYSAAQEMRTLLPTHYSRTACLFHYLHMARKNYKTYLQDDEVWVKKYFYVLRPLLACKWLENDLGAVPMEFERLVERAELSTSLNQAIDRLLEDKRSGEELRTGPRIPEISDFIESEFQRFEEAGVMRQKPETNVEALTAVFQNALKEVW